MITMPRDYKKWAEGEYYHIYNRGNAKENIFLVNQDYSFFIIRLQQNLFPKEEYTFRTPPLPENSFSLISYCLMPNHFHLLIRQNGNIPVTKLLSRICTGYSKYFNKKYNRVGHVFQDQFKQAVLDSNKYLNWLTAYIHQNPKVAGLAKDPADYRWSSYGEYLGKSQNFICEKEIILSQFSNQKLFQEFTEASFLITELRKESEHLLLDN